MDLGWNHNIDGAHFALPPTEQPTEAVYSGRLIESTAGLGARDEV